jgi:hypothetical protein
MKRGCIIMIPYTGLLQILLGFCHLVMADGSPMPTDLTICEVKHDFNRDVLVVRVRSYDSRIPKVPELGEYPLLPYLIRFKEFTK